jgi:hypothetical protein
MSYSSKILDQSGGIAQLGERLICIQEVIGSIPFTSTTFLGVGKNGSYT